MSEDYEFSDDPSMMTMEEDGEANSDDPMSAAGDCGLMGGEAEGSRIDASKNEEDEGFVCHSNINTQLTNPSYCDRYHWDDSLTCTFYLLLLT